MQKIKKLLIIALSGTLLITLLGAWSFITSPEGAAYNTAKTVIDENYKTHVLSIYGKGTLHTIDTWYVTFFDPTSETKAKVVVLKGGKIDRVHPSEYRKSFDDIMSFDPALNKISLEQAFQNTKKYAEINQITYDETRVSLCRPESGKAPVWKVDMRNKGISRGVICTNPQDGTFANYEKTKSVRKSGGDNFGDNVESTFLGVGGDLEEFFTGDRTVDR